MINHDNLSDFGRFWGLGSVFSIDWAFSMSLRTWSLSGRRVCLCRSVFRCFHPFGVGIIHPIISDSSSFTRSIGIGFDGQAGKIWQTLSSPIMLTMATGSSQGTSAASSSRRPSDVRRKARLRCVETSVDTQAMAGCGRESCHFDVWLSVNLRGNAG